MDECLLCRRLSVVMKVALLWTVPTFADLINRLKSVDLRLSLTYPTKNQQLWPHPQLGSNLRELFIFGLYSMLPRIINCCHFLQSVLSAHLVILLSMFPLRQLFFEVSVATYQFLGLRCCRQCGGKASYSCLYRSAIEMVVAFEARIGIRAMAMNPLRSALEGI